MGKIFIFLVSLSLMPSAHAWMNYGEGISKCGAFVGAMDSYRRTGDYSQIVNYIGWRNGFMTALGMANGHDFGELEGTEVFLENYCRSKPLSNYMNAVIELGIELMANR